MNPSSYKTKQQNTGVENNAQVPAEAMPALRGVHAHRWGEDASDEALVARFWRAFGVDVEMLEETSQHFSNLPDMRLIRQGKPWAFCEVKTIREHRWKIRILHDGMPPEDRIETSSMPVDERISGDLITAIRQLRAANCEHQLLNIVVIVNRDPKASLDGLTRLFSRPADISRRTLSEKHAARLASEIQNFRRETDLCLWTTEQPNETLSLEGCFLFNPKLRERLTAILGLEASKLIAFDPAA